MLAASSFRRDKTASSSAGRRPFLLLALAVLLGCAPHAEQEVVVYTALDEPFSRPIFAEFTRQTGIEVRAKFDVEATKSVQLTQAIFAEKSRPRCDVFWNNEIVNTLRLAEAGLLEACDSPIGQRYPAQYRDAEGRWYGFAARARVLVVNTQLVDAEEMPDSILDLVDERWQGRCGIAKPLAGTTATQAACLFAVWGDVQARQFFRDVKANCRIMAGNKQVARAVADGELAFGLTDTDDAIIELEAGLPVAIVFPDQTSASISAKSQVANSNGPRTTDNGRPTTPLGTLLIPNTLAIVAGAPHRDEAEKLIEYLLSPATEEKLASGPSAQIPLNPAVKAQSRALDYVSAADASEASGIVAMQVDFAKAAAMWVEAAAFLRDVFATAQ